MSMEAWIQKKHDILDRLFKLTLLIRHEVNLKRSENLAFHLQERASFLEQLSLVDANLLGTTTHCEQEWKTKLDAIQKSNDEIQRILEEEKHLLERELRFFQRQQNDLGKLVSKKGTRFSVQA